MEVDGPAVTEGLINGVEDPCHLFPAAWDVPVGDWMPRMHHCHAQVKRFFLRESGVWLQTFVRLREVDEVVDPRAQQGPQPGCSPHGVLRPRVVPGRQAARDDPVGIGQGTITDIARTHGRASPVARIRPALSAAWTLSHFGAGRGAAFTSSPHPS